MQKDKTISWSATRHAGKHKGIHTFIALIKSPAEILVTTDGKAMLRPPPNMFAPSNKRDRTKHCSFHEDQGYDTDVCINLPKRNGILYLERTHGPLDKRRKK